MEKYVSISSDDEPEYSDLEENDQHNKKENEAISTCCFQLPRRQNLALTFSSLINVFLLIVLAFMSLQLASARRETNYTHLTANGISLAHNIERQGNLPTKFMSENETEADSAWDAIQAGHGDVAIDPGWAAARGYPPSWPHPKHPDKEVYVIEAYHAIHCLKVLRDHYRKLSRGMAFEWPMEHDMHCFDSLRQHVMCMADDTLLYTTGHLTVGVGQVRNCRNWDALRDWATERTACYYDHINPSPEGEIYFGQCDGGEDGLPKGSLL